MKKIKKLLDEYRFPGFYPKAILKGKFGDHKARIIPLVRRQKKLFADVAGRRIGVSMIGKPELSGTFLVAMQEFIWKWKHGVLIAENV